MFLSVREEWGEFWFRNGQIQLDSCNMLRNNGGKQKNIPFAMH